MTPSSSSSSSTYVEAAMVAVTLVLLAQVASDGARAAEPWTWRRTMVLLLLFLMFASVLWMRATSTLDPTDPHQSILTTWAAFRAVLAHPLLWISACLAGAVVLFAVFLNHHANVLTQQQEKAQSAQSSSSSFAANLAVLALNALIVVLALGGLLFAVGWALDVLQFQRNGLGLAVQTLLFLPCKVFGFLSSSSSSSPSSSSSSAPANFIARSPAFAVVAVVFLVAVAFGLQNLINVRRTWTRLGQRLRDLQADGTQDVAAPDAPETETGTGTEEAGDSTTTTTTTTTIVPANTPVRLHRERRENLGAHMSASTPPPAAGQTFAVRMRLFLNSQQHAGFFAPGAALRVFALGDLVTSFLELRVNAQGVFLVSPYVDAPAAPVVVPLALQKWHDVTIEQSASALTPAVNLSVDGELLLSLPVTAPPSTATLVPDAVFFLFGDAGLNGVVTDCVFIQQSPSTAA